MLIVYFIFIFLLEKLFSHETSAPLLRLIKKSEMWSKAFEFYKNATLNWTNKRKFYDIDGHSILGYKPCIVISLMEI